MSSSLNFELSIKELVIPNYSGSIKCALVFANFSTTVSIPCRPVNLVNLKIDTNDKLYLSVFTQSSEVGCLEIPYSLFESGYMDHSFTLHESSISPEKERGQLRTTGEVHIVIRKLEDICIRCEGLERLVRDIKVDMIDIENTVHSHFSGSVEKTVVEEKKAGIKKPKSQVLRSGKNERKDIRADFSKPEGNLNKTEIASERLETGSNKLETITGKNDSLAKTETKFKKFEKNLAKPEKNALKQDPSYESNSNKSEASSYKPETSSYKQEMSTLKPGLSRTSSQDSQLELKKLLEESYKSRQELQLSVSETTEQLTQHLKEQRELLEQALSDRSKTADEVLILSQKLKNLEEENQKLKILLSEKESQINTLKAKLNSNISNESEITHLSEELEKSFNDNVLLENKLKESINSFTTNSTSFAKRADDLTKEKIDLQARIEELVKQNHNLKQENDRYSNLINELCGQIALLQAEIETAKAKENRENHLVNLLKQEEEAKKSLKKEFDELSKKFFEESLKFAEKNKKFLAEKSLADAENLELKQSIEIKDKQLYNFHKELEKAHSELAALEQHLCISEDQNLIIDQLTKQSSNSEKEKLRLSQRLNNMENHIESQNEKIRSQCLKITELENEKIEKEDQIQTLETLLDDLRKDREIYKPAKDDPIDIALSDYINTRPAALKVNFDREDHGRYNFGTKKIFVKLEQGKLLIRVGGGYMQVEDFVKLYSPVELERFSLLKKEQAQNIRKNYLGKYADSLATKSKNETSPERAIKLLKDQMASGSYTPYYAVQLKSPERSVDRSPSQKLSRVSSAKLI